MAMPTAEYACAIIHDGWQRFLFDLRPTDSRFAADRCTCFGGKVEAGEDIAAALRRELVEELAWDPGAAALDIASGLDLWIGERYVARFLACPAPNHPLRAQESGHHAVWVPRRCLDAIPLSPWHRHCVSAALTGHKRVELVQ